MTESTHTKPWDLYRDGITQSMLKSFMECPEKFRLANVEYLTLAGASGSPSADFGTLFHDLLDVVITKIHKSGKFDYSEIDQAINDYVVGSWNEFNDKCRDTIVSGQYYNTVQTQHMQVEVLARAYFRYYETDWATFKWLGTENVFDHKWETPLGKTLRLRGKRDGDVELNGDMYLFETKTKGDIRSAEIMNALEMDLQVHFYMMTMEWEYRRPCKGVIYNLVKRPGLRRKASETLPQFIGRIEKDINMDPSSYFTRITLIIDEESREKWLEDFNQIIWRLEMWNQGFGNHRNTAACVTKWGTCPYHDLCTVGDRRNYRERDGMFKELNVK